MCRCGIFFGQVSVDDEVEHPEIRKSQQDLITSPVTPITSEKGGLERQFVKLQLARNVSVANLKNLSDTKSAFTSFQQVNKTVTHCKIGFENCLKAFVALIGNIAKVEGAIGHMYAEGGTLLYDRLGLN